MDQQQIKEVLYNKAPKRVIERFIEACQDNIGNPNYLRRQMAVATQWDRDKWQVDDKYGRIMISKKERDIRLAHLGKFNYWVNAWFFSVGATAFQINEDQYEEMKKIYFSDFTFDQTYLDSL